MSCNIIKDMVTLIIPCYNAESFIENILQSVIRQTYKNIQLIIVNDGSLDRTDEKIRKLLPDLEECLTEVLYLQQKNGGAASAVNYALKYVKGEYLSWADADDELLEDNIRAKYEFLRTNSEYGMVMGRALQVDFDSGKDIGELAYDPLKTGRNSLFEDLIFGGIPVFPGVFMIRTLLLFEKIPKKEIPFDSEVGQNYQLLLPVAYDNKCGYIPECIYIYKVRQGSHSRRADGDMDKLLYRTYAREDIIRKILVFMDPNDTLFERVHAGCVEQRMDIYYRFHRRSEFIKCYHELKGIGVITRRKLKIKYLLALIGIMK